MGMLLSMVITLGQTTFFETAGAIAVQWNVVAIAVLSGVLMFKAKLTIPKTIAVAAVLGLLLG